MDHGVDQLECRRGQGNVTRGMDSFESKAEKEVSRTPIYPTTMVVSSRVGAPPNPVDSKTRVPETDLRYSTVPEHLHPPG